MHSSELSSVLRETPFRSIFRKRFTLGDIVLVPLRDVPLSIFEELLTRHGPGALHFAGLSGNAVLLKHVVDLFIEARVLSNDDFACLAPHSRVNQDESRALTLLASTNQDLGSHGLKSFDYEIDVQVSAPAEEKSKEMPVSMPLLKSVALTELPPTDPPKGAHRLAKQEDIDEMLRVTRLGPKDSTLKPYLELLQQRPWRVLKRAHRKHLKVMDSLLRDFPNFAEVIDHLTTDLMLQIRLKAPMCFAPLLLLGPPGVGKTAFVREFATRIGFVYEEQSIASMTSSFVLAGSHNTWGSADIGWVARRILELKDDQGIVFLLDELDKLQEAGRNHPVTPVLLSVLEPKQSAHFRDEFLSVPLDITPLISWIATANEAHIIPSHLQSRLQIKQIREPSTAEMPAVLR